MTEITQADWDAGLDLLSRHFSPPDRPITINVVAEAFARHRQYGYDQGYYDGRQADGAEERAKIVALAAEWMGDIEFAQFKHATEKDETFTHPDNV